MEKLMLQKLKWEVNPVTPHVLLHQIVPHLGLPACVPISTMLEVAEDILDACHIGMSVLPCTIFVCSIVRL